MRIGVSIAAVFLGACGMTAEPPLVATEVVVTQPVAKTGMSAAYMSLTNNTRQAITVSRVISPQFDSVMLHETTIENGVARMRALAELEIPARDTVLLQRGGKHLMLMRPTGPIETVSLQFFDEDDLILAVDATLARPVD